MAPEVAVAYTVPPLPYDYAALEPFIDAETMHLHHDKHHQAYVTNLNAALEKEEIMMEPRVSADQVDEAKVAAEIDRIAQARAELEKANGRMLLGIRKQLTPEQWNKLNGR